MPICSSCCRTQQNNCNGEGIASKQLHHKPPHSVAKKYRSAIWRYMAHRIRSEKTITQIETMVFQYSKQWSIEIKVNFSTRTPPLCASHFHTLYILCKMIYFLNSLTMAKTTAKQSSQTGRQPIKQRTKNPKKEVKCQWVCKCEAVAVAALMLLS